MERAAGRGEGIDPAGDGGVLHQRRGVVRLDAGIDDQGAGTAPVFLPGGGADPINVGGRVGTCKRHPQKVIDATGRKVAVVHKHDERKGIERLAWLITVAELFRRALRSCLHQHDTWQAHARLRKTIGKR